MTRDGMDRGVDSETSSMPEEFAKDPAVVDNQTEANSWWSDEVLVKSEVIILPDESLPVQQCHLCHSADHVCAPIFNLGGGFELTNAHFETIYRLSDIKFTYEKDHASVVCSYCLLKIEEYTSIREVWQMKNNVIHESKIPTTEPATTFAACKKRPDQKDASTQSTTTTDAACTKRPDQKDASTQSTITTIATCTKPSDLKDASTQTTTTSDCQNDHKDAELAAKCDKAAAAIPVQENSTINVDGHDSGAQCNIIDVEEYCARLEGERRKRRRKTELIEEVMQLVKKRYRSKSYKKSRHSR